MTFFILLKAWAPLLLSGAAMTLMLTASALCIGIIGGFAFGILSCNTLKSPWFSWLIRGYVLVVRGTPVYVQILLTTYALPQILGIKISPFAAGVIALGCNSIAYVAEIIRGGINSIPTTQWEACFVLGYSWQQTLRVAIIPQMLQNIAPSLVNEMISLLKETSIASVIGIVELTKIASILSAKTLDPVTVYSCLALGYLSMTTMLVCMSHILERKYSYDHR